MVISKGLVFWGVSDVVLMVRVVDVFVVLVGGEDGCYLDVFGVGFVWEFGGVRFIVGCFVVVIYLVVFGEIVMVVD